MYQYRLSLRDQDSHIEIDGWMTLRRVLIRRELAGKRLRVIFGASAEDDHPDGGPVTSGDVLFTLEVPMANKVRGKWRTWRSRCHPGSRWMEFLRAG